MGDLCKKLSIQQNLQCLHHCHETTTRAARPELGVLVTLIRLASNVRVAQGYRHGIREDSATLPQMKGLMGSVHDEA